MWGRNPPGKVRISFWTVGCTGAMFPNETFGMICPPPNSKGIFHVLRPKYLLHGVTVHLIFAPKVYASVQHWHTLEEPLSCILHGTRHGPAEVLTWRSNIQIGLLPLQGTGKFCPSETVCSSNHALATWYVIFSCRSFI